WVACTAPNVRSAITAGVAAPAGRRAVGWRIPVIIERVTECHQIRLNYPPSGHHLAAVGRHLAMSVNLPATLGGIVVPESGTRTRTGAQIIWVDDTKSPGTPVARILDECSSRLHRKINGKLIGYRKRG